MIFKDKKQKDILPRFRESAYTKIKQEIGEDSPDLVNQMQKKIEKSALKALKKRKKIIEYIKNLSF
jgi:hydrogenase expression/formation protein